MESINDVCGVLVGFMGFSSIIIFGSFVKTETLYQKYTEKVVKKACTVCYK